MAEIIIQGADTFIIDPNKLIENIKRGREILLAISSEYGKDFL